MNVSKVLDAAANSIDQFGWWPGHGNRMGRQCAMMAIGYASVMASDDINTADDRSIAALNALCIGIGGGNIPNWNDASDQATVTSTMRAVAAIERAREQRLMPVVYREPVTV